MAQLNKFKNGRNVTFVGYLVIAKYSEKDFMYLASFKL